MLRNVHLYGHLRKKFGAKFSFDADTASDVVRALNCAFPGTIVEALKTGSYQIIRGARHGGMSLDLELCDKFKLGRADLHIIPVSRGSSPKGRGTTKAVLGVALVGAAIFFSGGTLAAPIMGGALPLLGGVTYGSLAMVGVGLTLGGVGMMKAPCDAPKTKESVDAAASWAFSGPQNIVEQGGCVPLAYGYGIVGTTTISAGLDIENAGAYSA